jgi:hypothetical protein
MRSERVVWGRMGIKCGERKGGRGRKIIPTIGNLHAILDVVVVVVLSYESSAQVVVLDGLKWRQPKDTIV